MAPLPSGVKVRSGAIPEKHALRVGAWTVWIASSLVMYACAPAMYEASAPVSLRADVSQSITSVTTQILTDLGYEQVDSRICGRPGWSCFRRTDAGHRDQVRVRTEAIQDSVTDDGRLFDDTSDPEVRVVGRSYLYAEVSRVGETWDGVPIVGPAREVVWADARPSEAVRSDVDSLVRAMRNIAGAR